MTAPDAAAQPGPRIRYDLRLLDESKTYPDGVHLAPEHGKGYSSLSVRLRVTTPGRTARDLPTAAICRSEIRCEHTAIHGQEEELPSHTITLSDASMARLSRAGNTVTIIPLLLNAPDNMRLTVTLTIEGNQPIRRQVVYLASAAGYRPSQTPLPDMVDRESSRH